MTLADSTPKHSQWIISKQVDLLLYLLFPLLLAGAAFGAQALGFVGAFLLFVAIAANGHHVPTFLRIYGDPVILKRFPGRFILIPLMIIGGFAYCNYYELAAMKVVLIFWGHWHGMMQLYGFTRIYDAKKGSFATATTNLDWLVIFFGFLGAILFSELRMIEIIEGVASVGVPVGFLGAIATIETLQYLWIAIMAVLGVAYLRQAYLCQRSGKKQSPIKWLFMASSLSFWWFCNLYVANVILAIALVEVYHDLQYIGFVWEYNTNHAGKHKETIAKWQSLMFRKRAGMMLVYLGVVGVYGYLGEFTKILNSSTASYLFEVFIGTSTLCHFYFDGFIWKLKDRSIRDGFAVINPVKEGATKLLIRGISHNYLFVLVIAAVGYFLYAQNNIPKDNLRHLEEMADFLPNGPEVNLRLGVALASVGEFSAAEQAFKQVQFNSEGYKDVRVRRALNLIQLRQYDAAEFLLQQEVRENPRFYEAKRELAVHYVRARKLDQARVVLSELEELEPEDPVINYHIGLHALYSDSVEEAVNRFRHTLEIDPGYQPARAKLAAMGLPSSF